MINKRHSVITRPNVIRLRASVALLKKTKKEKKKRNTEGKGEVLSSIPFNELHTLSLCFFFPRFPMYYTLHSFAVASFFSARETYAAQ